MKAPLAGGRAGILPGALTMLVIVAALWASGVLPPRGETVPPRVSEPSQPAATRELSARLEKIEAALASQQAASAAQRPDKTPAQTVVRGWGDASCSRKRVAAKAKEHETSCRA